MRKFTFLITALLIGAVAYAQVPVSQIHLVPTNPNLKMRMLPLPKPVGDNVSVPEKSPSASSVSSTASEKTDGLRDISETIIGNTTYDLQTNRAISNRLVRNSDGTLSASWTTICSGGASSSRGTGYNYFNDTSWLAADCHRIEPDDRTGFPNIGVTASGKEFSIAHSSTIGTGGGILITSRPTKGSGAWTEDASALGENADDTWTKAVVGGADGKTIHAIWNASGIGTNVYCGQVGALVYSRSTDEGATWPVLHQCISLIDTPYYLGFSADDYAIAAQGNNVAILVSDFTTDLILLKSTDNGDTWTKTVIWQFPIPNYDETTNVIDTNNDGTPDIIAVPTGDGRVAFDKNGLIHVVFSETFVSDLDTASAVGYYPDADGGIWYWNESDANNPPVLIAAAEDLNGDGVLNVPVTSSSGYGSGTYGAGLSLEPTLGFDDANRIYVTYATFDENADTTAFDCGHRHVYTITSQDGGATWSTPFDIVPSIAEGGDGEDEEAVFADMAENVDDYLHIIYQRDPAPGTSLSTITVEAGWNNVASDIVYAKIQQGQLTGVSNPSPVGFSVSQNVPNPFNDQTQFNITLNKSSDVNVRVTNVLGQQVLNQNMNYAAGNHVFTLDKGTLAGGIYNFTVIAGGEKVTKKIIIE